jgi:DNA replication protein DnaC
MSERHHLSACLKKLRLPQVAFNLDTRIREARENDLDYEEFLSLLVQDEMEGRESNNLTKRIKAARFGLEQTFEGYDFSFNADIFPPKEIRELSTCRFIDLKKNLLLCGPPGIGKTHIARAIGFEACRKGMTVLFSKTHQLLSDLQQSIANEKYALRMRKLLNTDLLILDDFALKKASHQEAEILYELADLRLGRGSFILTSNRPTEDWMGAFPDPVIAGAVLDRLVSSARKFVVTSGKTHRKLSHTES